MQGGERGTLKILKKSENNLKRNEFGVSVRSLVIKWEKILITLVLRKDKAGP